MIARQPATGQDEQLIRESRQRIAYNKQQSQLRNVLRTVADEQGTISNEQVHPRPHRASVLPRSHRTCMHP